jgi:hypothetical protein
MSCRATLVSIQNGSFHAVLTKTLENEWQSHRSRFSRLWLIAMRNQNRIIRVDEDSNLHLLVAIQHACATDDVSAIVTKDFHLVSAALMTDQLLVSFDHTCIYHFRKVSLIVKEIAAITVADPDRHSQAVVRWLEAGAPSVPEWHLGHQ